MKRFGRLAVLVVIAGLSGCSRPVPAGGTAEQNTPRMETSVARGKVIAKPIDQTPVARGTQAPIVGSGGWVLKDLGSLGGRYSSAYGINEAGWVVGQAKTAQAAHQAFLYRDGAMTGLEAPGGMGEARAINESGAISGSMSTGRGDYRAFLYQEGKLEMIGTFGGPASQAYGISRSGHVVGQADSRVGPRAFLYSGGVIEDLGALPGGSSSEAYDINSCGHVVGASSCGSIDPTTGGGATHAFLYRKGVMVDLGTLGGISSSAYGINDLDHVVGVADTAEGVPHAFLYRDGHRIDLGTLGGVSSSAAAVNISGQVVGQAQTADGATHAFLYVDGVMKDLNRLMPANTGWVLLTASDLNEAGEIVGSGTWRGQRRAFLLSPPSRDRRSFHGSRAAP